VTQADEAGNERPIRTMGPDEVFGEIGLLRGAPRSATVTAATPGRLLTLDGPDFLDLVSAGAGLSDRLLALRGSEPTRRVSAS
jgi:CRP-like cAMP-binding protein